LVGIGLSSVEGRGPALDRASAEVLGQFFFFAYRTRDSSAESLNPTVLAHSGCPMQHRRVRPSRTWPRLRRNVLPASGWQLAGPVGGVPGRRDLVSRLDTTEVGPNPATGTGTRGEWPGSVRVNLPGLAKPSRSLAQPIHQMKWQATTPLPLQSGLGHFPRSPNAAGT